MPFDMSTTYPGLVPSACLDFPEEITPRPVPHRNLLLLFGARPWRARTRILCIHWSTELYGSKYALKSLAHMAMNALGLLLLKTFCRMKVVWVLHNNFAHEYPHPWIDQLGRKLVRAVADVIVAQQQESVAELRSEMPSKRVVRIPHCNFIGAYGPRAEKQRNAEDLALLLFGSVRPYKKIEEIIEALAAAGSEAAERIVLRIAGKGAAPYIESLQKRADGRVRLEVQEGFVPDADMPSLLASADYALFYFDESERTSGSLLLALSYGLPVIARAIPGSECVQDGVNGYRFASRAELAELLRILPNRTIPDARAVQASVEGQDSKEIEALYLKLYQSLSAERAIVSP
ncbi:MAG: glycosyl transferase group 1 [Parcubacteria group bacterium]|nr:glycosyl transferase group 1 [Parcubacteria group bacterium]